MLKTAPRAGRVARLIDNDGRGSRRDARGSEHSQTHKGRRLVPDGQTLDHGLLLQIRDRPSQKRHIIRSLPPVNQKSWVWRGFAQRSGRQSSSAVVQLAP